MKIIVLNDTNFMLKSILQKIVYLIRDSLSAKRLWINFDFNIVLRIRYGLSFFIFDTGIICCEFNVPAHYFTKKCEHEYESYVVTMSFSNVITYGKMCTYDVL